MVLVPLNSVERFKPAGTHFSGPPMAAYRFTGRMFNDVKSFPERVVFFDSRSRRCMQTYADG